MATAEYNRWVAAGRPYRLATPIDQLKDLARSAGVRWLGDLGNQAHLTDDRPEDHTPFSYTAWPVPLPGYVVCAIDLGDGPWSDRILADARAGRLPWLKYMNFRGHHYNVKRGWVQESSSDAHLHLSIKSDHTGADIRPYNPFVAGQPPAVTPKVVRMFVVEKKLPAGSSWYVTDGLRYRTLVTWNEVTVLRAVTGRPTDVVVTDQTTFDLLCGSLDAPEGSNVDLLTDEQVNALASRITTAFDATEIRQVLREELAAVRLTPGSDA